MDLISCHACGRQVVSQSRFCQYCGSSLTVQQVSSNPSSAPASSTPSVGIGENYGAHSHLSLPSGTRLRDRYIIEHQLGQGGFGRTYRAQDTGRFNEPIVLKELTPSVQGTAALNKAAELFEREAATLHRLQHKQIPRFWEIFQSQKRLFLVEDFIAGPTYQQILQDRQAQGQVFSEAEMIQLFRDLLPVLQYLHEQGVIHRDISPDNIIYRERDGLPVLIDLGGVKQIALDVATEVVSSQNKGMSTGGTRLGKVGYAPDEQMRLGVVAPHSDLYALAVTALVLLTGKPPQQLQDPQTLAWTWQQTLNLSAPFTQMLQSMLAPRPLDRFQSAQEVLQRLDAQMQTLPPPTEIRAPVDSGSAVEPTEVVPMMATPTPVTPTPTPVAPIPVAQTASGEMPWANTSGQGSTTLVPREVKGWNWGAFLLPGLWCMSNQVWVGLLSWAGLWGIMGFILGASGNDWAWRARQWPSVEAFKRHQRNWAIAGFITISGLACALALLIAAAVNEDLASDSTFESSPEPSPESITETSEFRPLDIPDLQPYRYTTGAFSIRAPEGWVRLDRSTKGEVLVFWNHISGGGRVVANVFDVNYDPTPEILSKVLSNYLKETFGEKEDFSIDEPQPQDDKSILYVFSFKDVVRNNIKYKVLGNSFIKNRGRRMAVLTLMIPDEQFPQLEDTLNEIINSFTINTDEPLPD